MTIYYHTTDAADAILSEGFRDSTGSIVPGDGVFLSEQPLIDAKEGATGDQLLRVEFGDDVNLNIYELPVGAPRQWFMPAAVINEHATVRLLSDNERDAAVNARLSGLAAVTTTTTTERTVIDGAPWLRSRGVRPPNFSERYGHQPYPPPIQLDDLDDRTRTGLWNFIYNHYLNVRQERVSREGVWMEFLSRYRQRYKLALLIDELLVIVESQRYNRVFDLSECHGTDHLAEITHGYPGSNSIA